MTSLKTDIVQYLFEQLWDEQAAELSSEIVTMEQVTAAIHHFNARREDKLSAKNPANFMKDLVRGQSASKNWPVRLTELRYTAVQAFGDDASFRFIPFAEGQSEPFPDLYKPTTKTPTLAVQSVSLPIVSKQLGRTDEPWLIQTAVNLNVVETHFATHSPHDVVELSHLQMSIKLQKTEIDAVFVAEIDQKEKQQTALITCEAKQSKERILEHQIVEQVRAAFAATDTSLVIPIGIRAVKGRGIYVAEFEAVERADGEKLEDVQLASDALYLLKPPVKGI